MSATGPLSGVKVLEFAALGPGPFAGTMLSDLGADVVRIERLGAANPSPELIDARGRRTLVINLKSPAGVELCLDLANSAEIVFEGNRPGVMERLGLGPDAMLARNPKLVYGRMTGWGQFGPYAPMAGHDINYLSLSGALHAIGTADKPVPPLNLVADYGGGSMFLMVGLLSALLHARKTGEGQVIDVAMTDGAAYLTSMFYGLFAGGQWSDQRVSNMLDGGAHFYDTYQCADGKWISIGAIEPQFYALLLELTGTSERLTESQWDKAAWPEMKAILREVFASQTRAHWCDILENTDVCFAPVLSLAEAPHHPHNLARNTFVEVAGVLQPAPAPRFSATPGAIQWAPAPIGRGAEDTLADWGVAPDKAKELFGE